MEQSQLLVHYGSSKITREELSRKQNSLGLHERSEAGS